MVFASSGSPFVPDHPGTGLDAARCQRNIVCDADVHFGNALGDPVIRRIRPLSDDCRSDQRVRVRPDAAVTDHVDGQIVAFRDPDRLVLYRAGICIDVYLGHVFNSVFGGRRTPRR